MVHGLIGKRRRSPGLDLLNSPFVSLVLGRDCPLSNKSPLVYGCHARALYVLCFPALLMSRSYSLHSFFPARWRATNSDLKLFTIFNDFFLHRHREMLRGSFPRPSSRQGDNGNSPSKHTPHHKPGKGKAVCFQC